ncbi:hypothetical protein NGRA_0567 [Nosema granulosis]|uniref:Uncharacterized protein n=1 Tax=Nosema granulosis TaxID=83296 RepID=A0A9P6L080_9MICR|nr:hypothetical protein NGRA_0567 [Nosema granulosis]
MFLFIVILNFIRSSFTVEEKYLVQENVIGFKIPTETIKSLEVFDLNKYSAHYIHPLHSQSNIIQKKEGCITQVFWLIKHNDALAIGLLSENPKVLIIRYNIWSSLFKKTIYFDAFYCSKSSQPFNPLYQPIRQFTIDKKKKYIQKCMYELFYMFINNNWQSMDREKIAIVMSNGYKTFQFFDKIDVRFTVYKFVLFFYTFRNLFKTIESQLTFDFEHIFKEFSSLTRKVINEIGDFYYDIRRLKKEECGEEFFYEQMLLIIEDLWTLNSLIHKENQLLTSNWNNVTMVNIKRCLIVEFREQFLCPQLFYYDNERKKIHVEFIYDPVTQKLIVDLENLQNTVQSSQKIFLLHSTTYKKNIKTVLDISKFITN